MEAMKTLDQIAQALDFEVLVGEDLAAREVTSGYACDMLSWVMAHAQPTDIWMTILNSINVIAVAVLTECACVLLTENVELPDDVAARARAKDIIVLRTPWSTYEASTRLATLLG
jgi:serine kinase of HPr protein (carbohydrate metabolism regulator)